MVLLHNVSFSASTEYLPKTVWKTQHIVLVLFIVLSNRDMLVVTCQQCVPANFEYQSDGSKDILQLFWGTKLSICHHFRTSQQSLNSPQVLVSQTKWRLYLTSVVTTLHKLHGLICVPIHLIYATIIWN